MKSELSTGEQRREWVRSVLRSEALTPAQKVVLMALETHANYRTGADAYPGEARLAEMCHLQQRAVRYALDKGRRLGFIQRTQTANRRRGLADVYRLVTPNPSTGTAMPVDGATTGTTVPVNESFTGTAMHDHRHDDNSMTGTAVPPNLPESSLEGEASREVAASPPAALRAAAAQSISIAPEQPPSRTCVNHPDGTMLSCPPCGDARRARRVWEDLEGARRAAANEARRREVARCPHRCDPNGRVETADSNGNDVLSDCPAGHGKPLPAVAS